ncbi:DUF1672 family protein [Sporosarcina sp. Marseille-Q4063]|uniref:DUF1672 family protein n=1 Tax=Sporosarcina sp. Marseille-Q4063 TaxID=2810514 RepID=UPI001BAE98A0|nr:DUF1672 family protein [Sporosarcina sp. Marseille-Q4063]QUW20812.1 DUF1672 family protein [Sporosarcina sp. Marseille-Q4063]
MSHLKGLAALMLSTSVILGGCSILNSAEEEQDYEFVDGKNGAKEIKISEKEKERLKKVGEAYRKENYVPVQEYIGEGFTLAPDNGTDAIAESHRDEVEQAVKKFFKENYKTDIKVHNIVGTTDAASVFVESVGEPHFYTLAIIPVDVKNETVMTDDVWSLEGEIEMSIITGLLAMINDEGFAVLDKYLDELAKEYQLSGRKVEALANVGADKYATPYYRLNAFPSSFQSLLDEYLENPNRTKTEWKSIAKDLSYEPERFSVAIDLFMSKEGVEPDEELIDKIKFDIEKMKGLPRAKYAIILHDNFVDKKSGRGDKENSLDRGIPDLIIKE